MRFTLEHHFDAPLDVVEKATLDDEYQARLNELPLLGERRVKELTERPDGSIHRVVHYKLGAQLPAAVTAVLGQAATWDEIGEYDPATHEWTFEIKPHVLGGRIECHGRYAFAEANNGNATQRSVEIDLKVKVPLVGGRAEKEIKKGLVETMDAEAKILSDYLNDA